MKRAGWSPCARPFARPDSFSLYAGPMPHIATVDRVSREELLEFLRDRHRHILMTTRGDGRPQLSPVTGGVDDSGRLVISTYPDRAKAVNLRRNPAASVLILSDEWDDPWVQVDGIAEGVDMPAQDGEDGLVGDGRGLGAEPVRRWGRPVGAGRPKRRGARQAGPGCRGRAGRVLPLHRGGAPGLAGVPRGDAPAGQVPDPDHHHRVGAGRDRRVPRRPRARLIRLGRRWRRRAKRSGSRVIPLRPWGPLLAQRGKSWGSALL